MTVIYCTPFLFLYPTCPLIFKKSNSIKIETPNLFRVSFLPLEHEQIFELTSNCPEWIVLAFSSSQQHQEVARTNVLRASVQFVY